jgi:hypothetical protein
MLPLPSGEAAVGGDAVTPRVASGDPAARQERLDEPALPQPALVLAVEQPVSQRSTHLLVELVVLAVSVGLAGQDAAHDVGVEDDVEHRAQPGRSDDETNDVAIAPAAHARTSRGCRAATRAPSRSAALRGGAEGRSPNRSRPFRRLPQRRYSAAGRGTRLSPAAPAACTRSTGTRGGGAATPHWRLSPRGAPASSTQRSSRSPSPDGAPPRGACNGRA